MKTEENIIYDLISSQKKLFVNQNKMRNHLHISAGSDVRVAVLFFFFFSWKAKPVRGGGALVCVLMFTRLFDVRTLQTESGIKIQEK